MQGLRVHSFVSSWDVPAASRNTRYARGFPPSTSPPVGPTWWMARCGWVMGLSPQCRMCRFASLVGLEVRVDVFDGTEDHVGLLQKVGLSHWHVREGRLCGPCKTWQVFVSRCLTLKRSRSSSPERISAACSDR